MGERISSLPYRAHCHQHLTEPTGRAGIPWTDSYGSEAATDRPLATAPSGTHSPTVTRWPPVDMSEKKKKKRACPTSHGRPSQRNSLSGGCLDSPSPASHPPASPASCDTGLESVCECFADTSALAEACLGKSPRAKNRVAAPSSLRSRLLTSTRLRPHVAAGLFGTGLGCAHPSLSATLLYFEQVLQLQRRLRPMRNRLPRACDALPGLPVLPESEPPEAFADRTAEYTLPVIDPKLSPNSRCHWCQFARYLAFRPILGAEQRQSKSTGRSHQHPAAGKVSCTGISVLLRIVIWSCLFVAS